MLIMNVCMEVKNFMKMGFSWKFHSQRNGDNSIALHRMKIKIK